MTVLYVLFSEGGYYCLTVNVVSFQLEYEGVKKYLDKSGLLTTYYHNKSSQIIAKEDTSIFIDGLMPKTVYTFNISAKFLEGSWGPPNTLNVETSVDG